MNFTAEAFDCDSSGCDTIASPDDFIDTVIVTERFTGPQQDFAPPRTVDGLHNITSLTLSYQIRCAENYCGPQCSEFCPTVCCIDIVVFLLDHVYGYVQVTSTTSGLISVIPPTTTSGPASINGL